MPETETKLEGGNVNVSVVRVGNTVRRSINPNSTSVHQLLLHLEQQGFAYSPKFLGFDGQNREILEFIEGSSQIPADFWTNARALIAAATMLREYHCASQSLKLENPNWAYSQAPHEVIRHNDFAPYNMIFKDGVPIAILDFDLVGPAPRLRDVAYCVYWFAPLSFSSNNQKDHAQIELKNNCPRLKLFCETYGVPVSKELFDMIESVLHHMSDVQKVASMVGNDTAFKLVHEGHLRHWQLEWLAFRKHRKLLEEAIGVI